MLAKRHFFSCIVPEFFILALKPNNSPLVVVGRTIPSAKLPPVFLALLSPSLDQLLIQQCSFNCLYFKSIVFLIRLLPQFIRTVRRSFGTPSPLLPCCTPHSVQLLNGTSQRSQDRWHDRPTNQAGITLNPLYPGRLVEPVMAGVWRKRV